MVVLTSLQSRLFKEILKNIDVPTPRDSELTGLGKTQNSFMDSSKNYPGDSYVTEVKNHSSRRPTVNLKNKMVSYLTSKNGFAWE